MSDPLNEIHRALGRIEQSVKNIETNQSNFSNTLSDHDDRIASVESWKTLLAGCALIGSTIGTAVATGWGWISEIIKSGHGAQ